jgi:hypothetical protein
MFVNEFLTLRQVADGGIWPVPPVPVTAGERAAGPG